MSAGKMHVDEVDIDVSLVRRLLAAQFPQWVDLPIAPIHSAGTDNAIYRLGKDLAMRLPRIEGATGQVEKEQQWLPRLAPYLPLAIPVPLALGTPDEGYPWQWSVYRWLEGANATIERIVEEGQAARDLAQFVTALQQIDPTGGPLPGQHNSFRGAPLSTRDAQTRASIASLDGMLDTGAWSGGVGRRPPGTSVGRPARLAPRRPATSKPAGRTGSAECRYRLRVSGRGRSRMRLDRRLESSLRRSPGRLPRSTSG